MNNRKLLVTGGAGFIGANFVHYCINKYRDCPVIVLDALTYAGNRENLSSLMDNPRLEFIHGDIRDEKLVEQLLVEHELDTIVNFAAESHVDRSISGPDAFIDTNITGTHCLLKTARKIWLDKQSLENHRFHHVSTDEVYGSLEPDDAAFTEETAYDPSSPYSASKASSDHLVRAYHRTYGLNITISNCSNNYGPYQFPEKLIPLMVVNLLDGKKLPVYGKGLNIRDWLFVEDHCSAIDKIINHGVNGHTYNIGGKNEIKNIDIVNSICEIMDDVFNESPELLQRFPETPRANNSESKSLIEYVTDRPGHDFRYAINPDKIEKKLGFEPLETFDTGLPKTIRWYIDNENWWRKLISRHQG